MEHSSFNTYVSSNTPVEMIAPRTLYNNLTYNIKYDNTKCALRIDVITNKYSLRVINPNRNCTNLTN